MFSDMWSSFFSKTMFPTISLIKSSICEDLHVFVVICLNSLRVCSSIRFFFSRLFSESKPLFSEVHIYLVFLVCIKGYKTSIIFYLCERKAFFSTRNTTTFLHLIWFLLKNLYCPCKEETERITGMVMTVELPFYMQKKRVILIFNIIFMLREDYIRKSLSNSNQNNTIHER